MFGKKKKPAPTAITAEFLYAKMSATIERARIARDEYNEALALGDEKAAATAKERFDGRVTAARTLQSMADKLEAEAIWALPVSEGAES